MTYFEFFKELTSVEDIFGNIAIKHVSDVCISGRPDTSVFEQKVFNFGFCLNISGSDDSEMKISEIKQMLQDEILKHSGWDFMDWPVLFKGKTVLSLEACGLGAFIQTVDDTRFYEENHQNWKQQLYKNRAVAAELPVPVLAAEYAYYLMDKQ